MSKKNKKTWFYTFVCWVYKCTGFGKSIKNVAILMENKYKEIQNNRVAFGIRCLYMLGCHFNYVFNLYIFSPIKAGGIRNDMCKDILQPLYAVWCIGKLQSTKKRNK